MFTLGIMGFELCFFCFEYVCWLVGWMFGEIMSFWKVLYDFLCIIGIILFKMIFIVKKNLSD